MMTFEELVQSLLTPNFWESKSVGQVNRLLGSACALTVSYDQRNPHHCYTLFEHCLTTAAVLRVLCEAASLPTERRDNLLVAALLHDVAKPRVAFEKKGRLVFYGHANCSAIIADELLERMGCRADRRRAICFLIAHHDDFIACRRPERIPRYASRYIRPICRETVEAHIRCTAAPAGCREAELWHDLCLLMYADASAQAITTVIDGKTVGSRREKQLSALAVQDCVDMIFGGETNESKEKKTA